MAKVLKKIKKAKKIKKPLKKKTNIKLKKISKIKKTVKKVVSKKKGKIKKSEKKLTKDLERFVGNPVIFPAGNTYWESKATFNPTAFIHDGEVHVIYRAVGVSDMSTLGYAKSHDGYYLSGRSFKPIFMHKNYSTDESLPIFYSSGGGWNGGAEDPRITKIDNMLYLTYTAFDGWGSVRIGLTSISLKDFLSKRWNWKRPVLISPPGEVHKNWVIFPEKINGKYAILHGLSPEILIEYVKDMNSFDGKKFIKSIHQDHPKWQLREKGMRGVGGAPIKTKYGWLVFYHAMESHETHRYKLWAMILDLKDPTKVLYRSIKPILEPDAFYENEGLKSGVIYSCGAIVKGDNLFVYYGGADMVSCLATANLKLFLKELISTGITKLSKKRK
jgi:beta-1,2-mannobiose phosphorylase / 1,2-beta-oligomannan phosphorylase